MRNYVEPRVCAIILNWNGLEDTLACLASLKKVRYENLDLLVVDNGSEGNDAETLRNLFGDEIYLIRNEVNAGYAGGNNIGIAYAIDNLDPDYLLLLNNDTLVDPDFLRELAVAAEKDPGIGIVGPKTLDYHEPDRLQFTIATLRTAVGKIAYTGKGELDHGQYDAVAETQYVQGSCMLIKSAVCASIGLLNEDYFAYWEDMEFCIRAIKAGFKLAYCPSARIWHKGSASTRGATGIRLYYGTRNRFMLYRAHIPRSEFILFLLQYFGFSLWASLIRFFVEGEARNAVYVIKGIRDGLFHPAPGHTSFHLIPIHQRRRR